MSKETKSGEVHTAFLAPSTLMSAERPTYLPELPPRFPRSEFVPGPLGAGERQPGTDQVIPSFEPLRRERVVATAPAGTIQELRREREEQERVSLHGRLGTDPEYKTTAKGQLVARFRFAVPQGEGEKPVWETIIAFGEKAERMRDKLTKGQEAEVIGYRHQRTYTGRDGKERTVQEIYSVAVRTPKG